MHQSRRLSSVLCEVTTRAAVGSPPDYTRTNIWSGRATSRHTVQKIKALRTCRTPWAIEVAASRSLLSATGRPPATVYAITSAIGGTVVLHRPYPTTCEDARTSMIVVRCIDDTAPPRGHSGVICHTIQSSAGSATV